jgi:hypothetical protein
MFVLILPSSFLDPCLCLFVQNGSKLVPLYMFQWELELMVELEL